MKQLHSYLVKCFLWVWLIIAITNTTAHAVEVFSTPEIPLNARAGDVIPDVYIVVLKDEVSSFAVQSLGQQYGLRPGNKLYYTYNSALKGFAARLSEESLTMLKREPGVDYIEKDTVVSAFETQIKPMSRGLDRIDQKDLPRNNKYDYQSSGNGVSVYVIDTGIFTAHNDFGGRAQGVFTSINDGNGANDCNGHGTHVAGTIGGALSGVAKFVTLYGVRVLDCKGSGSGSGVIAGIDWVTADFNNKGRPPSVANMSLGGGASDAEDQAVRDSINAGITYSIAAGNESTDACIQSPARVAEAITVGATNESDSIAYYSNWGSCLDLYAPGTSITSAGTSTTNSFIEKSGTSMAAPHVAGIAALYLELAPQAMPRQVSDALIAQATLGRLKNVRTDTLNALAYSLVKPISPVTWVDFSYNGGESGDFRSPFNTLAEGVNAVVNGGTVAIKSSSSPETITISKPVTILSWGGSTTIGK